MREWDHYRRFLGIGRGPLVLLVASSVLAGVAEAAVIALAVQVAGLIQSGDTGEMSLGPITATDVEISTLLWLAFGLAVVRLLLQSVAAYLPARWASNAQADLRARIFSGFAHARWGVQSEDREGYLQEVSSMEVYRGSLFVLYMGTMLSTASLFVALLASAFVIDWAAALAVALGAAVLFFLLRPLSTRTRAFSDGLSVANTDFGQGVSEAVRLAEESHTFGVQAEFQGRIQVLVDKVRRSFFLTQLLGRSVGPVYQSIVILALVGGLAVVSAGGSSDFTGLATVVLVFLRGTNYTQQAQSSHQKAAEAIPALQHVERLLQRYEEAAESPEGTEIDTVDVIEFRRVSFSYGERDAVLRDVSVTIPKGETVGVIGPSGAGKSTFVQLLLRLRSPVEGELIVNGRSANEIALPSWFRHVAHVPQEAHLVDDTVTENIRFYRPWITDDDVRWAARAAHIEEDVAGWADGFDTVIGQRVGAVSGGQRQRLCLARALAGRPSVLVLDEPTSALDPRSERLVSTSLSELHGDLTVVIVAHRLSTLDGCDRLLVFEDGRLVVAGSHEELSTIEGYYRDAIELASSSPSTDPLL